jgi:hypothetical protein
LTCAGSITAPSMLIFLTRQARRTTTSKTRVLSATFSAECSIRAAAGFGPAPFRCGARRGPVKEALNNQGARRGVNPGVNQPRQGKRTTNTRPPLIPGISPTCCEHAETICDVGTLSPQGTSGCSSIADTYSIRSINKRARKVHGEHTKAVQALGEEYYLDTRQLPKS